LIGIKLLNSNIFEKVARSVIIFVTSESAMTSASNNADFFQNASFLYELNGTVLLQFVPKHHLNYSLSVEFIQI